MTDKNNDLVWHKVLSKDELPEGRVTTATCENRTLCMSHFKGKYGMNITHVLMNNGEPEKISKEQRAGNWDVWQTSLHNPDFSAYAELCGALWVRVKKIDDLDAALEKALSHPGPALVEVMTDTELV